MDKMNIPFSPPDISEKEIEAVSAVLRSGWITTGPKTKEFERKIAQVCHTEKAVCLNSATAALELTLRLLGIGPGDEVITSAYTYTASCSPILHVGATPILIDVSKDSFEMDYTQLENIIHKNTKAIIPIDIAGIVCDYEPIFEIVKRKQHIYQPSNKIQKAIHHLPVITDAAHAFGAKRDDNMSGEIADFTTFSFHAVKNLTTAEGGAATWRNIEGISNEWIYEQYQLLSLHGQTKDALSKDKAGSWEYDVAATNYKCNMTDIMAAIGLAQMERYDEMMERRHEIIRRYDEAFLSLPVKVLNHKDERHKSSGHLYLLRVNGIHHEKRCDIITKLAEAGVTCNVHYKPLPLLTAYKNLGFDMKDYPNAYQQYENEITLPLRSNLSDKEVDYIIKQVKKYLGEVIVW